MQAIILAAGMGRRLGELTSGNTKCMVEVNGIKLIDRALSQLKGLGISRVVIVVGYEGQKLIDYLADRYKDDFEIVYVNNPVYDKTNNIYSLALAKDLMMEDDTILLESDLIFDDAMIPMAAADPNPNIALVAKYETWMDGTMVRIDEEGNIVNFIPKKDFNYAEVDTYYKTVNVYKFSKEFARDIYVPFLEAYSRAMGNNEYYEQVLRVITYLDKADLKAVPIGNLKWYEIDDIQDLDIAEALFARDASEQLSRIYSRYGGFWRFPGMLDFCYLVNPYFPNKRLIEEMTANFSVLLHEYPSGMRVNSLLAAKCFGVRQEYVVPGNGAAELIKSLMTTTLTGQVGVVLPTFEEYPNRYASERIIRFVPDTEGFRYSADDLMDYYADKDIQALLVVNPDNPSGNFLPIPDVLRLAAWCESRDVRLIIDESFVDFSKGWEHNSLLHNDILEHYPHMAVMKSISKSYGVPGLRLGILCSADKEMIAAMKRDVAIWNINSFAEFFMQIYTKYEGAYKVACAKFQVERDRFQAELEQIPFIKVFPTEANYFLCEVLPPYSATCLTKALLSDFSILIKDCSTKKGFEGRDYIRIAVRDPRDNDALIAALRRLS